jgi:amino acid transporter
VASIETGRSQRPTLHRTLTLPHAALYGLGVTIGAGIYVLIGAMAGRAGVHAPVAFIFAALIMGLTAASYAELACRHPVSAGAAAYVGEAFERPALTLLVGLLTVAVGIVSAAAISIGSTGYIRAFVDAPQSVLLPIVVLTMGAVAAWGIRESVTFAAVMTLIEMTGLILVIVSAFWAQPQLPQKLLTVLPPLDALVWSGILAAGLLAFFAFIGFEDIANIAEEVVEPERTLPRAILLTMLVSTVLYVLVAAAAVLTVPPPELAASKAPLSTVFDRVTRLPPQTFSLIAILATLNGIIVQIIMVARVLYGLAMRGHLPRALGHVHAFTRTPLLATGLVVGSVLAFALLFPLEALAEWTSRITLFVFALVNLALLKIKSAAVSRPMHIFSVPAWVPVLGAASCLLFLLASFVPR